MVNRLLPPRRVCRPSLQGQRRRVEGELRVREEKSVLKLKLTLFQSLHRCQGKERRPETAKDEEVGRG